MIYESREASPRRASGRGEREAALALFLFSLFAAGLVRYGLGAFCTEDSGWPCLTRSVDEAHSLSPQAVSVGSNLPIPPAMTPTVAGFAAWPTAPASLPTATLAPTETPWVPIQTPTLPRLLVPTVVEVPRVIVTPSSTADGPTASPGAGTDVTSTATPTEDPYPGTSGGNQ
jgi:hypothetical protein